MTGRIVATHRIFPETVGLLQQAGTVTAPQEDRFESSALAAALTQAEAMMVFMPDRIDSAVLDAAPRLRIVAAALKGYDNIDVDACTARGVWLSIVPDLLTVPTAELTIGLIVGLARHLRAADAHVRESNYTGWAPRFYGAGLEGSTVGLIGMGAIGCAIAQRLRGFDCRTIYYDERRLEAETEARLGVTAYSLDDVVAASDVLVLGLPLRNSTLHLFDEARLSQMKPGALLVNPARGSLVDEAAVARALTDGRLGGYAADAFELEDRSRPERPTSIPARLLVHPNTLFGAHIGSATVAARQAIEARAAMNIIDVLGGKAPRDAINTIGAEPWRARA